MALRILYNAVSNQAQLNLDMAQRSLNRALIRLSSGLRINTAADDPAGFMVAGQTQLQIIGNNTGSNNLLIAIDLLNTADSFGRTIQSNLERMAELGNQAANQLLTTTQRSALNFEFRELVLEIQRLTENASFMGKPLFTGSLVGITIQSGFSVTDVVTISIETMTVNFMLGTIGLSIGAVSAALNAVAIINSAVANTFGPAMAIIGAQGAAWLKSVDAQNAYAVNLGAARSRIIDADIAQETTNLTNSQVVVQSGIAALAQANAAQALALGLIGGR